MNKHGWQAFRLVMLVWAALCCTDAFGQTAERSLRGRNRNTIIIAASNSLKQDKKMAGYGKYGFTFGNYVSDSPSKTSRHTNTLIDCTDEANANFMKFAPNPGRQTINILNLNMEFWPQWFAIEGEGHYATEVVPGQYNGQVNYTMNRGGGSIPNVTDHFWAAGSGHNFQSRNNVHKKVCSSEERRTYYPNFGQEVFDTTLSKRLICIDPEARTWVDDSGNVCD